MQRNQLGVQRIGPGRAGRSGPGAPHRRPSRATICRVSQQPAPPATYPPTESASTRRRLPRPAAGLSWGQYARSLLRRLAALASVLLIAIWALTGRGYFWPAWAWLGLVVVVLCDYSAGWVWRRRPGAPRRVAFLWAVIAVAAAILVMTWLLTWLLAGARTFWPAWALLGLATAGSAYSLIALHDRVLIARARRALRAGAVVFKARVGSQAVLDLDCLTTREREVLALMAAGRSNGAIAASLVVSLGAIEKHITNIFAKLDLPACDDDHRRVLAVLAYLRVAGPSGGHAGAVAPRGLGLVQRGVGTGHERLGSGSGAEPGDPG